MKTAFYTIILNFMKKEQWRLQLQMTKTCIVYARPLYAMMFFQIKKQFKNKRNNNKVQSYQVILPKYKN